MKQVVSVKFSEDGRAYSFDPGDHTYAVGEEVIVETANGPSFGFVSKTNHEVEDSAVVGTLKKVLRLADDRDRKHREQNAEKAVDACRVCEKKIADHKLEMKLVNAEYAFDNSKITFFFTADGRVDFRELVRDLAGHFHTRIELRQIGVRDEARMLGGIGICGQPYCCKRFLDDFQPVSIKMAKEQNLSLNPTKISGSCGRLMCCLKYEQEAYEHLMSITPGLGAQVKGEDGTGTVVDVNLITGNLLVRPDDDGLPFKTNRNRVKVLSRGGKRSGNGAKPANDKKPAEGKKQ